ncbi:mitochondrial 1-like glutamate carrier, partial [Mytilus galloprovincialis]
MTTRPASVKFGNAAVAGITGVTINFPVDLCKTRLQNAETGPNGEKIYKSLLDCAKKTYKAEGFFGMYRGWAVNTLLITPEKCIKLGLNDLFCHHFGGKDGTLQWYGRLSAGGLAGACQIIVTTPMELLKIQLQDAGRSGVTLNADGTVAKKTALGIILTSTPLPQQNGIIKMLVKLLCFNISQSVLNLFLNNYKKGSWFNMELGKDEDVLSQILIRE